MALIQADLLDAREAAVDGRADACRRFGRLDALVNNASSFFPTPVGEIAPADWNDLIGTNLQAPLFLAQAAAPALRKAQGAIVNITDIHAERPLKNYVVYSIAKAGLVGLTRSLARELAPEVRVNAVAPGPILWPDDEAFDELSRQRIISHTPLRREGTPDDIAKAVHFLLADAPYVTGETINVDGGRGIRCDRRAGSTAVDAPATPQRGDLRGERLEIGIDDAVRDERHARALEVVERRAERAARARDDLAPARSSVSLPAYCGWSRRTTNVERASAAIAASHARPTAAGTSRRPSRAATAGATRRARAAPAAGRATPRHAPPRRAPAPVPARSGVPRDASDHRQNRRCSPRSVAGRASTNGNSGFHSSDPYANTHQPAPLGFAASVAVERLRELLVVERVARAPSACDIELAHAPRLEVARGTASSGRRSVMRVTGSFCSSILAWRRCAPVVLPCAPALAEQRRRATGLRGLTGVRRSVTLRAFHSCVPRSARNSDCRSFRKRRPSGVGRSTAGSGSSRPLRVASPIADATTAIGRPVRSANIAEGTPSVRRSAFSMNSNGRSRRDTSTSSCSGAALDTCSRYCLGCFQRSCRSTRSGNDSLECAPAPMPR